MMNILYCTNQSYVMPMCVSITSLFENNKNIKFNLYIFHSQISDLEINKIKQLEKNYQQTINLILVPDHFFNNIETHRWSKEVYYRLLINELIKDDIDKILYLDCDTIINNSVENIYQIKFTQKDAICALYENGSEKVLARLELNSESNYFQSSVFILDIKKSKNILNYENIIKLISEKKDIIKTVDQDILNILFNKKSIPLDIKYNDCASTGYQSSDNQSVIYHYISGKPWNNMFSGSLDNLWFEYLKISPYEELYYTKYSKFKYKILRSSFMKSLFFHYIRITPYINNSAKRMFPKKNIQWIKRVL